MTNQHDHRSGNDRRVLRGVIASMCIITVIYVMTSEALTRGHNDNFHNGMQGDGTVSDGGYSIFHETMADMTWQEVERAAEEGAVVLIAGAVIEEHGPHMVNGIDTYLGYIMCKLIRRELESRGINALIVPPFYWGINGHSQQFPGTFTVTPETMKAILHDIYSSLKSWNLNTVFYFNSHGESAHIFNGIQAILNARDELEMDVRYLLSESDRARMGISNNAPFVLVYEGPSIEMPEFPDIHAGAFETGVVAAYFPGLVNEELARTLEPTKLAWEDLGRWAQDVRGVTPLGYLGDPADYDAMEARTYWDALCRMAADAIEAYLKK